MMREKCTEKSRHNMPDNGRKESRIVSGITTKKGSRKDAREMHRGARIIGLMGAQSGFMGEDGWRQRPQEKTLGLVAKRFF